MSSYFIGIDGGGTKTYGVIADEKGNMLASAKRDSSNYLQVGIEKARENMVGMIEELCASQGIDLLGLDYAFIALAGAGRPDNRETIAKALISGGLRQAQIEITPDFTSGLAGGTFGKPGVIVISGTGSVVFGISEKGEQKRVGGWGHILADEGSGYQFGQEALRTVMKAYDGRIPPTKLTDKILKTLNLENPERLVNWSLSEGIQKNNVAALSPYVFEAFNEGDAAAEKIIDKSVSEMVDMVGAAAKAMGITNDAFNIVLAGGNFGHQPKFVEKLSQQLKPVCPNAKAGLPHFEPIVGAVIMALKNQQIAITDEVIQNLNASWPKMNL